MATRLYLGNGGAGTRQSSSVWNGGADTSDATAESSAVQGNGTNYMTFGIYKRTSAGSTTQVGSTTALIMHSANMSKALRTDTFSFASTTVAATDAFQINMTPGNSPTTLLFCSQQFGSGKTIGAQTITFAATTTSNASSKPAMFYGNRESYLDFPTDTLWAAPSSPIRMFLAVNGEC
jgi:hypothetical protein